VVTTGAILVSRAKLQSNHHHRQTNSFLQAGCPSCRPTNSVEALKGKCWQCMPYKCLMVVGCHLGQNPFYFCFASCIQQFDAIQSFDVEWRYINAAQSCTKGTFVRSYVTYAALCWVVGLYNLAGQCTDRYTRHREYHRAPAQWAVWSLCLWLWQRCRRQPG